MDGKALRKTLASYFNLRKGRASYETMRKRIIQGLTIDGIHLCALIASMLIASIGLNTDSTEAVVGAMLICPLMGSVLGISWSVATLDRHLLRDVMFGLLVQVIVCLITSTLYFVISPLNTATSELLTNSNATVWDVLIAFVGGFAGGVGNSRRQEPSTLIAGVAVATALMPPLCSTGYGLAMKDLVLAASAFYEFLINVVFIAFGAELVLLWLRVPVQADLNGDGVITAEEQATASRDATSMHRGLVIGSLLFAVPCIFFSAQVVQKSLAENGTVFEVVDTYETEFTTYELGVVCPELVDYRIGTEDSYDKETQSLVQNVVATVETSKKLSEEEQKQIEELIRLNVTELDSVSFEVTKE